MEKDGFNWSLVYLGDRIYGLGTIIFSGEQNVTLVNSWLDDPFDDCDECINIYHIGKMK